MNTQNNSLCPLVMAKSKFALSVGLYEIDDNGKLQNPILSVSFQSITVFEDDTVEIRKEKLLNDLFKLKQEVSHLEKLAKNYQLMTGHDGTLDLNYLPDYLKSYLSTNQ